MPRNRISFFRRGIAALAAMAFVACGGNSDSGRTEPNTTLLVNDVCRGMRDAPCASASAEQECIDRLGRDQDDATNEGCESELNAYLECAAAGSIECSANEGEPFEPHVASACSEKLSVFSECVTGVGPLCALGYGPGTDSVSCSVTCPDEFSSMCTGPTQFGPLECTCSAGPRAGVAFQATDCSRGIIMATGHNCR